MPTLNLNVYECSKRDVVFMFRIQCAESPKWFPSINKCAKHLGVCVCSEYSNDKIRRNCSNAQLVGVDCSIFLCSPFVRPIRWIISSHFIFVRTESYPISIYIWKRCDSDNSDESRVLSTYLNQHSSPFREGP